MEMFDPDKVLLRLFIERNRIITRTDKVLLTAYARTCSSTSDFWSRCENPAWMLAYLEYIGCNAVPGIRDVGYTALREVEHYIVHPSDQRSLEIVYTLSKEAVDRDEIRKAYLNGVKEAEHYSDRKTGIVTHHRAADYACDAARALLIQDELLSTMYCIVQAGMAIVTEGHELRQVRQACEQRDMLFKRLADDVRTIVSDGLAGGLSLCPEFTPPRAEEKADRKGPQPVMKNPGWVSLNLTLRYAIDLADPLSVQYTEHALANKVSVMGAEGLAEYMEHEPDGNITAEDMDEWLMQRIEEQRRFISGDDEIVDVCQVEDEAEDAVRDRI